MSSGLSFDGAKELRAFFETLPDGLAEKAAPIVARAAQETAAEARDAYPQGDTGNLRKGVKVKSRERAGHVVSATVINTSPHSHLYEEGSEMRQTKAGAVRGQMPARPVIRKIAPRKRREMTDELIAMIQRETGAVITNGGE